MIVGVIHNTLHMQTHVIYFRGVTSMDQVYVPSLPGSIPELYVRIRTATETITADMLHRTGLSC